MSAEHLLAKLKYLCTIIFRYVRWYIRQSASAQNFNFTLRSINVYTAHVHNNRTHIGRIYAIASRFFSALPLNLFFIVTLICRPCVIMFKKFAFANFIFANVYVLIFWIFYNVLWYYYTYSLLFAHVHGDHHRAATCSY